MKFTTILWDNDGVLVDTERHFFRASQQILEKEGITLTKEQFTEISLHQGGSVLSLLKSKGFTDDQIEEKRVERNRLYDEFLTTVHLPVEGIENVLKELKKKYRMYIVTSSGRKHFDTMHARTGLLQYFEGFITSSEYHVTKPSPVPYLHAMKKFNVAPELAVAIEDSPRGVESAKSAGLFCIAIPNPFTRNFDYSKADVVLESVGELVGYLG